MKASRTVFTIGCAVSWAAWVAKMQFIPGGDLLFRIGTAGMVVGLVLQLPIAVRNVALKASRLDRLFIVNTVVLALLHLGMMLKVAHVLDTQFQKDVVLDLLGIPVLLTTLTYSFGQSAKVLASDREAKVLLLRHVVYPWTVFVFSYLFYVVYSVILARAY